MLIREFETLNRQIYFSQRYMHVYAHHNSPLINAITSVYNKPE